MHFSIVMKEVEDIAERLVEQHPERARERVLRRVDTVHLSGSQPKTTDAGTSPLKRDEELMSASLSRPQNCWSSEPGRREGASTLFVSPDNSGDARPSYSPSMNSVPSYSPMHETTV